MGDEKHPTNTGRSGRSFGAGTYVRQLNPNITILVG